MIDPHFSLLPPSDHLISESNQKPEGMELTDLYKISFLKGGKRRRLDLEGQIGNTRHTATIAKKLVAVEVEEGQA